MTVNTREFGPVEYAENDVITFVRPIYGFDELKRFIMLCDDEVGEQFAWLQSVEEERICFVLINPYAVDSHYAPTITDEVKNALGEEEPIPWAITFIKENFEQSTVNLKSPVLVNTKARTAMQVILEDDYPIRQTILAGSKEDK